MSRANYNYRINKFKFLVTAIGVESIVTEKEKEASFKYLGKPIY